jgi:tRNA(Ile)-lysidine synthase
VSRPPSLVEKVRRRLDRAGLGAAGVVAVSGGADSVALWRALTESGAGPLVVAHLNHGLRGQESDADEAFVRGLGAEVRAARLDVAAAARAEGGNLEAVARRLRYDWLAGVARETGSAWVATGHTADDQAETVLHRMLRGTGLRGLRGIAPRRPLPGGVELIRPLLDVTRAEVLAYLAVMGQPFREDRTNADPSFTRNRIRHELLPLLAGRYNTGVVGVLGRLAEQADEVFADEERRARELLAAAELPRAGHLVVLDRVRLTAAPRHLVREAFRVLWEREGWPVAGMGFEHWERLADLAAAGAGAVDLPDGVRARCRDRVVQVGRR